MACGRASNGRTAFSSRRALSVALVAAIVAALTAGPIAFPPKCEPRR